MRFRLIPISITLNDLKWRNSPNFAFLSPISVALLANYVIVVEDRPIMSANVVSQFQFSTFCHNQPTLQRGLSATAELLVPVLVLFVYQILFRCPMVDAGRFLIGREMLRCDIV